MDPFTLVSTERAARGAEFLSRLRDEGLTLDGALWAQVEGDGRPYLYIASPNVESEGPIAADRRMDRVLRRFQPEPADPATRIDPFAIKLIGPSDPVARALALQYNRYPGPSPVRHSGEMLWGVPIDGAYIYPATLFTSAVAAAPPG